jgi:hypothetical protein
MLLTFCSNGVVEAHVNSWPFQRAWGAAIFPNDPGGEWIECRDWIVTIDTFLAKVVPQLAKVDEGIIVRFATKEI